VYLYFWCFHLSRRIRLFLSPTLYTRNSYNSGLPEGAIAPIRERIEKLTEKLNEQLNFISKNLRQFPIGQSFRITRTNKGKGNTFYDSFYGIVTGIDHKDRGSSPAAPSAWHLKLALSNGEVKSMTLPLSAINTSSQKSTRRKESLRIESVEHDMWSGKRIYELFDDRHEVRQNRQMLTGNIVKACDRFPEGKITNFTDYKGRIRQGLLLPKKFDLQEKLRNEPVVFKEPYQIKAYFSEITEGKGRLKTMDEMLVLRMDRDDQSMVLEAPRSKQAGGKYYLDEDLINRVGQEFVSSGDFMRAKVAPENIESTLLYILSSEQIACFGPSFLEAAREYMGITIPEMEEAPEGETLDIEGELFESNVAPYVEEPTADDRKKLESLFNLAEADETETDEAVEQAAPDDEGADNEDSTADITDETEIASSESDLQGDDSTGEVGQEEEPPTEEIGEEEIAEEDEKLADWEIEELLERGDLDGVMDALVEKIDLRNLEEDAIAPQDEEDAAMETSVKTPENTPEVNEEGIDDAEPSPQTKEASSSSENVEISSETETANSAQGAPTVKKPEEYRTFAEEGVSQFLHAADLAEAVMEEGFHLKIENVPYNDLNVETKREGDHLRLTFSNTSDAMTNREMTFEISQDGELALEETATVGINSGVEYRVRDGGDRSTANLFSRQIIAQNFAYAASEQMAEQVANRKLQEQPQNTEVSTAEALEEAETALDRLKDFGESISSEMASLLPDMEPDNLDVSNDVQDLPQEISDGLLRQVTQELAAVHAKSNNFILFSEVRELPSLKGLSRDSQDRILNALQEADQIEMHTLVNPGDQLPEVIEQGIPQIQGGYLFSLSIYNQFERHADAALKAHFDPLVAEIQVAEASGRQLTGEDFSRLTSLEHKLQQMPEALREYYSSTMLTKLQEMGALTILDASTGEPLQDSNLEFLSNSSVIKTLSYSPEDESNLSAARASERDNLPQGVDTELAAQITELRAVVLKW